MLSALTETALGGRAPQAIHGGWTISARHAGVVIGLLALTPVFTADIAQQREDAIDAGTAVILDSRVDPLLKLELAQRSPTGSTTRRARCRRSAPPSSRCPKTPRARPSGNLRDELQDQLDRGATHAFSPSFGLAALLGLLALIPIASRGGWTCEAGAPRSSAPAAGRRRDRGLARPRRRLPRRRRLLYTPRKTQDPCKHREWRDPESLQEVAKQFSISALDAPPANSG